MSSIRQSITKTLEYALFYKKSILDQTKQTSSMKKDISQYTEHRVPLFSLSYSHYYLFWTAVITQE